MRQSTAMPRSFRPRSAGVLCAAGLLLIGCAVARAAAPTDADLPVPTLRVPPSTVAVAPAAPHTLRAPPGNAKPVRIDVPTLGVSAPVVPVAVRGDGELTVPEDPRVVGWWAAGGGPDATLVLDGHVDTAAAGPGALFHLRDLPPGAAIGLATSDSGVLTYTVTAVRTYPKAELPPDVFRPAAAPRLVIVTCGGHFNRTTRQYIDNIVAYAEPA